MPQPEIRCGGHGFQCAYCIDSSQRRTFCDRHYHLWENLCLLTQHQVYDAISDYNSKVDEPRIARKKLQRFINRVMILDELNKLRSNMQYNTALDLSKENQVVRETADSWRKRFQNMVQTKDYWEDKCKAMRETANTVMEEKKKLIEDIEKNWKAATAFVVATFIHIWARDGWLGFGMSSVYFIGACHFRI